MTAEDVKRLECSGCGGMYTANTMATAYQDSRDEFAGSSSHPTESKKDEAAGRVRCSGS